MSTLTQLQTLDFGKFSLAQQIISQARPVEVAVATNHIGIIDVSGSMCGDLPELRRQLKNKLPSLVKPEDTITLIWFSGRGQFGVLQEGVRVKSPTDLAKLNDAIDRFLVPIGLTGFKEPLEETGRVMDRLAKKNPNTVFSLFFMSDGCDNQWQQSEIVRVISGLSDRLVNAAIVEYGWYADRNLLSKMAEAVGGQLIFSQNFSDYQATFEREISKNIRGGKKIEVLLALQPTTPDSFVFSFDDDGTLMTYTIENGKVMVPEHVTTLYYMVETQPGGSNSHGAETYMLLTALSQRMAADRIFDVLAKLGDVYLVNRFVNSFSKQDYTDFQSDCVAQATTPTLRFREGQDFNAVPKEDAFTVFQLLNMLQEDEGNLLYPLDPEFEYKRIGAAREAVNKDIKFKHADPNPGVSVRNLVFNADRPNISVNVRYEGSVQLPDNNFSLPNPFPSHIYRSMAIVKDGIVHCRKLPVSLTEATLGKLRNEGMHLPVNAGEKFLLDISALPVINRKMVRTVNAKDIFTKAFRLEQLKGTQKVLKYYQDKYAPKTSKGFEVKYGKEATDWLKELGISEYNGFNPKSETVAYNDVYTAKLLTLAVAKLSSLPKVEDMLKKYNAKEKLTLSQSVMVTAEEKVRSFLTNPLYTGAADKDAMLKIWLETETRAAISEVRKLNNEISQAKFSIIVGHTWFNDLDPGQESLTLNVDGNEVTVTAALKDKEIGKSGSDD